MKRMHLGVGIAVVVLLGAGALVYASVPHAFNTGDTLQAADLNGNFSALDQRITALESGRFHWDGYLSAGGDLSAATTPSGTLAHVTFTPPSTGDIVVRVHFSTAARNFYDTTFADCGVVSQLSTGTTAPSALGAATGTLGVSEFHIAGTLPTQYMAGTYQWFPQSAEAAFPATSGTSLTVYLNGFTDCKSVHYLALSFSAEFVPSAGTVSVSAN
jgi:hypothetical protein